MKKQIKQRTRLAALAVGCILVLAFFANPKLKQLNEKEFELEPFNYRLVRNDHENIDGIRMTSISMVSVDRVEIPNYLESHGCTIHHCDWSSIIFTTKEDRVDFLKKHASKLRRISKRL